MDLVGTERPRMMSVGDLITSRAHAAILARPISNLTATCDSWMSLDMHTACKAAVFLLSEKPRKVSTSSVTSENVASISLPRMLNASSS